jgi:hypothetical protein
MASSFNNINDKNKKEAIIWLLYKILIWFGKVRKAY